MSRTTRQVMIAFAVVALLVALARLGVLGGRARGLVMNVSVPVVRLVGAPFRAVGDGWTAMAGNRRLVRENEGLLARIAELDRLCQTQKDLANRCRQLEDLVALKETYPELVPAHVVLRDDLAWSKSIVIDRGTRDGLTANMTVVSGGGLVGKITDTGYAYSRVLLMSDKSFKVGARLTSSRCTGLLEGGDKDELLLNFLPRDATVVPGEEVITSGMGGVFPAGYLIGHVRNTVVEERGFYQCAHVSLAVTVNTLELVAVIKRLPPDIDVTEARDSQGAKPAEPGARTP